MACCRSFSAACIPASGRLLPQPGSPGLSSAFPAGILDIGTLADLSNIGTLFAFVLVSIGVIILRYAIRSGAAVSVLRAALLRPSLSVFFCVLLMSGLPILTWLRFFAWLVIGLTIYWLYSRHHSEFAGGKR